MFLNVFGFSICLNTGTGGVNSNPVQSLRLTASDAGGETSFTRAQLVGATIVLISSARAFPMNWKTVGPVSDVEVLFDPATGTVSVNAGVAFQPKEEMVILFNPPVTP